MQQMLLSQNRVLCLHFLGQGFMEKRSLPNANKGLLRGRAHVGFDCLQPR